jgi:hypothetical protein
MIAATVMSRDVKLNTFPEVGDPVAVHLSPGLMNPMLGAVTEIIGCHLVIELNDSPGVFLVVPRNVCTWC